MDNAPQQPSSTEDKADILQFDVPLFTRVLERVLEDIKSDEDLHKLLTSIIALKNRGVLTMKDYDDIISGAPKPASPKTEKEVQESLAKAYIQIVNNSAR